MRIIKYKYFKRLFKRNFKEIGNGYVYFQEESKKIYLKYYKVNHSFIAYNRIHFSCKYYCNFCKNNGNLERFCEKLKKYDVTVLSGIAGDNSPDEPYVPYRIE